MLIEVTGHCVVYKAASVNCTIPSLSKKCKFSGKNMQAGCGTLWPVILFDTGVI